MTSAPTRGSRARLVAVLAAALAVLFTAAPGAGAAPTASPASDIATVAAALRESPVYVDPAASDQLSAAQARDLANRIEEADKPVFLAVLPAGFPTQDLFTDLRTATGITGLYGVRLGDRFDARADSSVLPRTAVRNLVGSVQGEDAPVQLTEFTDRALANIGGRALSSWDGGPAAAATPPLPRSSPSARWSCSRGRAPTPSAAATAAGGRRSSGPRWSGFGWSSTRTSRPSARNSTGSTSGRANRARTTRCAPTTDRRWTRTSRRSRRWRGPGVRRTCAG